MLPLYNLLYSLFLTHPEKNFARTCQIISLLGSKFSVWSSSYTKWMSNLSQQPTKLSLISPHLLTALPTSFVLQPHWLFFYYQLCSYITAFVRMPFLECCSLECSFSKYPHGSHSDHIQVFTLILLFQWICLYNSHPRIIYLYSLHSSLFYFPFSYHLISCKHIIFIYFIYFLSPQMSAPWGQKYLSFIFSLLIFWIDVYI